MKSKVLLLCLVVASLAVLALSLAGCSSSAGDTNASNQSLAVQEVAITRDENFGDVFINLTAEEFNDLGFAYGDSVNVEFSNGYALRDVPYFSGYYVKIGDPLLVGHPEHPLIEAAVNYGDPLWDTSGVSESDTATITLVEAGKYATTQEAMSVTYSDDRSEYDSDEQFANFRALSGGNMTPGTWYRSASPINNSRGRAPYVNSLMEQAGVTYVLNLSDNEGEIAELVAEDDEAGVDIAYFKKLHDAGNVAALDLSASYMSQSFKEDLADGFIALTEHDGPYLVHCVKGEDRTGFVCALLEALAEASYSEIVDDYMKTNANYYGITEESDPDKYRAIKELNIDGMLAYLAGCEDGADMTDVDFSGFAADYLRAGGMTEKQIEALKATL